MAAPSSSELCLSELPWWKKNKRNKVQKCALQQVGLVSFVRAGM